MKNNLHELENIIGVKFNDINVLKEALTHPSYANEHSAKHNQRLEFLGDAVLELSMSDYLYKKYKTFAEGDMTKHRAQSVCEEALYIYSMKFGLNKYLLLGAGEEQKGGRERPSLIADAFEAVLGAVYIDQGFSKAKEVFDRLVLPYIDDVNVIQDYKTKLQEFVRTDKKNVSYEVINETGPSHDKTFEVLVKYDEGIILGTGIGKTKKEAEQMAAKEALKKCGYIK